MAKLLDTPAAAPAEIRRLATLPRNQVFIGYSVLASWGRRTTTSPSWHSII